MLYKKDDPSAPENYRPNSLLPILYKLFTRLICSRIGDWLDGAQTADQAGFRSRFACFDHLHTIVLLIEAMSEFQLPLWICAIDFKKAFDTVEHHHLWESLHQQNVPNVYTRLLARLYVNQTANIITDKVSKPFRIGRGTKQGDPISPKLFNAVLERAFGRAQERWRDENYGVRMTGGQAERITNLRFADDVLLIATSREHLQSMLEDLVRFTEEVGLEMHMGKRRY